MFRKTERRGGAASNHIQFNSTPTHKPSETQIIHGAEEEARSLVPRCRNRSSVFSAGALTLSTSSASADEARSGQCERTPKELKLLESEAKDYENNKRFKRKIAEVCCGHEPDARQPAIMKFLEENDVFVEDQSVLDLGCAAGSMLMQYQRKLRKLGGHKRMVGVELVPGWVAAANKYLENIEVFEGDITHFEISGSFNLVTMNDVLEHLH